MSSLPGKIQITSRVIYFIARYSTVKVPPPCGATTIISVRQTHGKA
jgi:hypothetical protein